MLSCSSSKAVFVNGIREIIKDVNYDITLLDWLRNNLQITGTKEGCAEGDCGACSVLINEGKNFAPKPVNSCLLRLGQVIGKNIITIEGIGTTENPHPLQIAFSKQNASQCGYCTPGFIVSAFALLNSNKKINNKTIHDTFSGNLCRCTGYSPIVRAVKSTTKKSFKNNYKFFDEEIKNIKLGNVTYYNPKSLSELKNLTKSKNFKFLAGGTDLNLQRPVISENENILILLNSIEELKKIKFYENKILLGSLVSIENLLELIEGKMPEMTEVLQRFGSPQIRNQATIGGNLCTSSPIGDLAPIFLVLNANLNIFGKNGFETILLKDFFIDYRKNILKEDQILVSIEIPIVEKANKLFFWKLSKRFDQDISTISLAINIRTQNQIVEDLCIAVGGVAAVPKILEKLSKRMIGKRISKAIDIAVNEVENYVNPISDLRGTADYRIMSLKGLFNRLEHCLNGNKKNISIMEF